MLPVIQCLHPATLTFSQLELVQNGGLSGSIQTDHEDAHLLLAELRQGQCNDSRVAVYGALRSASLSLFSVSLALPGPSLSPCTYHALPHTGERETHGDIQTNRGNSSNEPRTALCQPRCDRRRRIGQTVGPRIFKHSAFRCTHGRRQEHRLQ